MPKKVIIYFLLRLVVVIAGVVVAAVFVVAPFAAYCFRSHWPALAEAVYSLAIAAGYCYSMASASAGAVCLQVHAAVVVETSSRLLAAALCFAVAAHYGAVVAARFSYQHFLLHALCPYAFY